MNLPYFFAQNHKIQNTCWKQWPIVSRCYNIWTWKLLFPVWNRLDLRSWKFHGETITTSWDIRGGGGWNPPPPPNPYQHQNNAAQIRLTYIYNIYIYISLEIFFSQSMCENTSPITTQEAPQLMPSYIHTFMKNNKKHCKTKLILLYSCTMYIHKFVILTFFTVFTVSTNFHVFMFVYSSLIYFSCTRVNAILLDKDTHCVEIL